MSDIVVDSSVVAKWILPEEDSITANRVLTDVVAASGRLIVLDLALVEVSNAIWKRHYRGLITADEANQLVELLLGSV